MIHRVRRSIILVSIFTLLLTALAPVMTTRAATSPAWGSNAAPVIKNGPNRGYFAVLTYDDCPYAPWVGVGTRSTTTSGRTPQAALTNYQRTVNEATRLRAKIVIAPTGYCVSQFKKYFKVDIAQYARVRGQLVMSHSYNHQYLTSLKKKGIRYQMRHSENSYWVRPPYGAVNPKVNKVLKSMHKRAWTWTYSSTDWMGYDQQTVVSSLVENCKTGDSCLNHLNTSSFTPEAMRLTVEGMRAKGTRVCGVKMAGGKPVKTVVRWRVLNCAG